MRSHRGFTLIEVMTALAMVGGLAAVAIPMAMDDGETPVKAVEAETQLEAMAHAAKAAFLTAGAFPQGAAMPLPGSAGAACNFTSKKFPATRGWKNDPVWRTLGIVVDEPTELSYHYVSTDENIATITAVADLDCTGVLTTYSITLTAVDGEVVATTEQYESETRGDADGAVATGGTETR